ncbi:DNA helicase Pif1 like family and P-loop containing nucleoside triphosphate hydrolase domain-containing protein [Strongyloides ratti]|uniref:ATP-dependent DNA helicase n=1 Tax=Strongyloides ratti TaxID=34506 RepID=A0A090L245_STRRB|nr:DNA helicase Pif1 like family and P-loop containing nucleoside triphosphate hydrolase domain-containing protein [Strongyloides ratti]CEF61554.1 DNA helicase Pif1 like family and P-loop containing nucleoside triphosphate hydrolase domain-containing protein [Strongyloides ratti]
MIEEPAGTGKTYVYQLISKYLKTEGKTYVNLATTDRFQLRSASAIFIDKISMLSAKQLAYIYMALKHNTKVFKKSFGDGRFDNHKFVTLPHEIVFEESDDQFIEHVFGKRRNNFSVKYKNTAILATTNNMVNDINEKILNKYFNSKNQTTHYSVDNLYFENKFENCAYKLEVTTELLNTFNSSGYPLHEIILAKNCILICLRNLNIKE